MDPLSFALYILFVFTVSGQNEKSRFLPKAWSYKTKSTYGDLLKSIVKVNDDRYNALKLHELKKYKVATPSLFLKAEDNLYSNTNGDDHAVVYALKRHLLMTKSEEFDLIPHDAIKKLKYSPVIENSNAYNDWSENDEYKTMDEPLMKKPLMLRNMWKGCSKKSAKVCRKSCIKAYKSSCSVYECSRRLKSSLKKDCKLFCKANFNSSK